MRPSLYGLIGLVVLAVSSFLMSVSTRTFKFEDLSAGKCYVADSVPDVYFKVMKRMERNASERLRVDYEIYKEDEVKLLTTERSKDKVFDKEVLREKSCEIFQQRRDKYLFNEELRNLKNRLELLELKVLLKR
jgi:hypothetical protein